MRNYRAADLARQFRVVRGNTIRVAKDLPEDQYAFRAAPGVRSVGEMLAHVAVAPRWQWRLHGARLPSMNFAYFDDALLRTGREQEELSGKSRILDVLDREGREFADWMASLADEVLDERVVFEPTGDPPSKTRFEMLVSVREHELHHRGQLMLVERLLGIVPHLTSGWETGLAEMRRRRAAETS